MLGLMEIVVTVIDVLLCDLFVVKKPSSKRAASTTAIIKAINSYLSLLVAMLSHNAFI